MGRFILMYSLLFLAYLNGFAQTDSATVGDTYEQEPDSIYEITAVDEPPVFKGGEEALLTFLRENILYPANAKEKKIEGVVIVQFVVDKKGKISNLKVLTPEKEGLDEEALRVVKRTSGLWTPASYQGHPVNTIARIPINFKLY